jgi:hypothetical protein
MGLVPERTTSLMLICSLGLRVSLERDRLFRSIVTTRFSSS